LEALIISLKPSEAKDALTKASLTLLYKLDDLPKDPNSPAHLCNPDTYTHRYLETLTGIMEKHDHKWWSEWWSKNQKALQWNAELDRFELKPE
jgi:hypothetical protein